jgi:hypothetical protein
MFLAKRSANWTNVMYVQNSWKSLGGIVPERLVILDAVWKKEIGRLAGHCELVGVNKGYIVVKTDSSVVYNELVMSSRQITRSLNKYFSTPWLKGIKQSA